MFQPFIVGFIISFLGSIPVGVLNLTIVDVGIKRGLRQVFLFSLAAALVEYSQGFLALKFSSLFNQNPSLAFYIDLIATPIFFILGWYYLWQHHRPPKKERVIISDFNKAIILSVVNPLAIPFWVIWGTISQQKGWLDGENLSIAIFTLGISAGTFLTLFLYGYGAKNIISRIDLINQRLNQIIGWILILLGVFQVVQILWKYY